MEDAILQTIREMIEAKRKAGKAPLLVTRMELDQELTRALNALYANGEIQVGKTANDKWIKISQ